jgi:hypothetical protein
MKDFALVTADDVGEAVLAKQRQLLEYAMEINAREESIQVSKRHFATAGCLVICKMIEQGEALLKVKASLRHGEWEDWVEAHCPNVVRTARRYMTLAANRTRVSGLEQAKSLREALRLCAEDKAGDKSGEPKSWPGYIEALSRFSKFTSVLKHCPISEWPEQNSAKLREEMRPIVELLWPQIIIERPSPLTRRLPEPQTREQVTKLPVSAHK